MLNYKNYIANIKFDDRAEIFYGEVANTRDVITFQGKTAKELKKAFIDSVEDYLTFCAERNETPDKPFSGKFNLRIDPLLHKEAYSTAQEEGISLNQLVTKAVSHYVHEIHTE
jgi:predicted HicB family RNase H-like nuclease